MIESEIEGFADLYANLKDGRAVRTRIINSNRNKVLCLNIRNLSVRLKVTKSVTIAIQDTNEVFLRELFPDHYLRWKEEADRKDFHFLEGTINFMRIRMELRRDLMDLAFADPVETLKVLKKEHQY